MDRGAVSTWIDGYERAWRTAGTELLGELFAPDASYRTAPYERPFSGLEAIAVMWEGGRNGADEEFEMTSEVVAVDGATAVARVEVRYGEPRSTEYRDLWVMRFDSEGRCVAFEEWPFWPPGQKGGWIEGPEG